MQMRFPGRTTAASHIPQLSLLSTQYKGSLVHFPLLFDIKGQVEYNSFKHKEREKTNLQAGKKHVTY